MNIGLSAAAFYGRMETEDQAAYLKHFDIDACEVFLETHSEYNGTFGRLVREKLGGLNCVSCHPKGTQYEPDLFGLSHRQQEDSLRTFRGVLDAGQAMGAKWYIWHGPPALTGPLKPGKINRLGERFPLLQEEAARHGLEILWENVNWCAVSSPEDIRELIAILPDIRFVLDVKQAFRGGEDPFQVLSAMGERVQHVLVLDRDASGQMCLPGQGCVDFRRLMGQLRDQGFDGAVILEPYPAHARDDGALRRALDFLREAARV